MNIKLNKTDYLILGIFYLVSILLQVREYIIRKNSLLEYFVDIPVNIIVSISLILLFGFWLIPNYIVKKRRYVHFVFFGLILLFVFGGIDLTAGFWSGDNDWKKFPALGDFIFRAIDFGAEAVGFPLGLLLTKKFYEGQTELVKAEKQQKENELKLLRSQLDPHFLFNNLNTLDALIDSNPNKAKEYINRLSLIYRYLIQTKDAEVMELSREIELAENYMFLIKTRFENDYVFEIKENVSIKDKFIPTGAIQALLENVVKHNKAHNNEPIKTTISINDGWLIITNSRSKVTSKQESFGTGLENLKSRYKLLSDQKIQIHTMDKKFEVFIPIIRLSE